jgi:hypothetical protein
LDALDPVKIDNLAPVRTKKDLRIESQLERIQGTRHQCTLTFEMDPGIVPFRFQQLNVSHLHYPAILSGANKDLV